MIFLSDKVACPGLTTVVLQGSARLVQGSVKVLDDDIELIYLINSHHLGQFSRLAN